MRNVTRKLKKVSVRTLAAAFPRGKGKGQRGGRVRVRHVNPPKKRKVGRPGQQRYAG